MRKRIQAVLHNLLRLPRAKRARFAALALAALVCIGATGVFANASLAEVPALEEADPARAALARSRSVPAPLSIDTSLYADLPDVERVEYTTEISRIPHAVTVVEDPEMYMGESYVQTPGADGWANLTYAHEYVNGELQRSYLVQTDVLITPAAEVVVEGSRYRPFSTGTYLWPTTGVITSRFGPRSGFGSSNHKGLDIAAPLGTPVYAADAGLITRANDIYSGYGNLVWIQHDNGDVTYYAHLSAFAVSEGEFVEQGQLIGYMGSTGTSSGSHLHFEIRRNGEALNPENFLPQQ